MVKTTADEAVYAIMATASLPKLKPIKLETGIQVQDPPVTSSHAKATIRGEVHHPGQGVSVDSQNIFAPKSLVSVYIRGLMLIQTNLKSCCNWIFTAAQIIGGESLFYFV